ncbi:MAG: DUF115 domain-containing protein [Gammaproteobacteria bacterium]|nr:DUF115 domain-containing protein [Gammaproteobacteria bacterium]
MDIQPGLGNFLTNRFGERYLYSVNGITFTQTDSTSIYQSHFGKRLFRENHLYIIVGTDSGLLPKYILHRGIPEGSRYLFIEHDEIFKVVTPEFTDLNTQQKLACCSASRWEQTATEFYFSEYAYTDSISLFKSLAVTDCYLPQYREIWCDIEHAYNTRLWATQAQLGTSIFCQRQIENLAENNIPATVLRKLGSGQTAVIMGGGPSLDEILPWIQENKSKITTIAASRISRRLLEYNLYPDIVVSVDPHPISFDVSREMLLLWKHTLLVNANHITPLLLGQWRGRNVYFDEKFPWTNRYDNDNVLSAAGPTVTNCALSLAIEMGFSQIILAGVDLCFSREGFSHAKGSNESIAGPTINMATRRVKTNAGDWAETENSLFKAVTSLEQQAKLACDHGIKIINPAPSAAMIEGISYTPCQEIILGDLAHSIKQSIDAILSKYDQVSKTKHLNNVIDELSQAADKLKRMDSLVSKAILYNNSLFDKTAPRRSTGYKEKLDKIEEILSKKYKEYSIFSKIFGMTKFVRLLKPFDASTIKEDAAIELGRSYYLAYQAGIKELSRIINEAIERTKSRRMELENTSDIDILSKQWKKDNQPGRVLILKDKHAGIINSPNAAGNELYSELEASFNASLSNMDTPHMRRSKTFADLRGIDNKASELYNNSDSQALKRLLSSLQAHPDERARALTHLVSGYLAEIENNQAKAITEYQYADAPPAIEPALRRLSMIALDMGDYDSATIALKSLATLSPVYIPQLSELLRIKGDLLGALDTLTEYLEFAEDDFHAMLRVGLIYRELGQNDNADWVFRYILEKDPANFAAKNLLENKDSAHG